MQCKTACFSNVGKGSAHACVHAYVLVYLKVRGQSQVSSAPLSSLGFETESLTTIGIYQLNKISWTASPRHPPVPDPTSTRILGECQSVRVFYLYGGRLNLGPHAGLVSTLPTEPSPQPLKRRSFWYYLLTPSGLATQRCPSVS